jgi:hypothetical protein
MTIALISASKRPTTPSAHSTFGRHYYRIPRTSSNRVDLVRATSPPHKRQLDSYTPCQCLPDVSRNSQSILLAP